MSNQFEWNFFGDVYRQGEVPIEIPLEIPHELIELPNGQEGLVLGTPEQCADFNHQQGDNPYGFLGTCGLVSCEDVLRQFGIEVTEGDVVRHAIEVGACFVDGPADICGGTTASDQAQILSDFGVPAHSEHLDSLEQLANCIEEGRGVIIEVNAGVLWNNPAAYDFGQANHAIVATGVVRDPESGDVLGFFINDSGNGDSCRFVETSTMQDMWMDTGGACVLTDITKW